MYASRIGGRRKVVLRCWRVEIVMERSEKIKKHVHVEEIERVKIFHFRTSGFFGKNHWCGKSLVRTCLFLTILDHLLS